MVIFNFWKEIGKALKSSVHFLPVMSPAQVSQKVLLFRTKESRKIPVSICSAPWSSSWNADNSSEPKFPANIYFINPWISIPYISGSKTYVKPQVGLGRKLSKEEEPIYASSTFKYFNCNVSCSEIGAKVVSIRFYAALLYWWCRKNLICTCLGRPNFVESTESQITFFLNRLG